MTTDANPLDLAAALHIAGRLDEAETQYRKALAADPRQRKARNNLIALLRTQGRWDDAEALLREAIEVFPDDRELKGRLGTTLLASGRYTEGWPLYEHRRGASREAPVEPKLSIPEWGGEPIEKLLVWPEGGFGDAIQFSRFLPELQRRGVEPILICWPELAGLLADSGLNVIAAGGPGGGVTIPRCQAWSFIGSLPLRLGATLDNLPPPLAIRAQASGAPGGVGVMTKGRPTHLNDASRSLPADLAAELLKMPAAVSLDPEHTGARDFRETAQIIAGLDHVLSVDTAVAHLAASMGKPVSLLVPRMNTDWRWMRERTDSPWYPTIRLYRQVAPNDWGPVLAQAIQDLGPLAVRPAPKRTAAAVDPA